MVKQLPQQLKVFRKVHKGLVCKYEGPFRVLHEVGKVSYTLELSSKLKIHPVFHMSMLKHYKADEENPSMGESHRAQTAVVTSFDKDDIEEILGDWVVAHQATRSTWFVRKANRTVRQHKRSLRICGNLRTKLRNLRVVLNGDVKDS